MQKSHIEAPQLGCLTVGKNKCIVFRGVEGFHLKHFLLTNS